MDQVESTAVPEILVCWDQEETAQDRRGFRCCPLGVQFYTRRPLAMFKILMLDLCLPDGAGQEQRAKCEGIVVHTAPDTARGLHRIWVLFTNMPEEFRRRLQCWSKEAGTQCPHCMNY
ncbi:MAG: hypothetical protein N2652_10770 [Kiritimatiellae bacterium]|nr:hypothetical protein [Kiritimatiellia bacterium]